MIPMQYALRRRMMVEQQAGEVVTISLPSSFGYYFTVTHKGVTYTDAAVFEANVGDTIQISAVESQHPAWKWFLVFVNWEETFSAPRGESAIYNYTVVSNAAITYMPEGSELYILINES